MGKTCAFVTLGCKVNQYDTQAIREGLRAYGYREVAPEQEADLVVVNTCTVTGQGGAKSRKEIRRLRRRHPQARVVVTGCYVESDRAAVEAMDGIAVIAGNAQKFSIPALVEPEMEPPEPVGIGTIDSFEGHTRAFLKVEDGCDLECTFCIIPSVRGAVRSKPVAEAAAEARRLVRSGHKEIVLTGIHLGAYGAERDGETLADLVRALDGVDGLERVRLSSIEVNEITEPLLGALADSPKVCPHLHLPLQAGDDATLKRMRRHYSVKMFRESVERIRSRLPEPAFTTDVIVGFPGETQRQFDNTIALCRAVGFIKIHVFPYSVRSGTPAARIKTRVSAREIEERTGRLLEVSDALGLAHRQGLVGHDTPVLLEGESGSPKPVTLSGLSPRYERVVVDNATTEMINRIVRVRIERAEARLLFGRIY